MTVPERPPGHRQDRQGARIGRLQPDRARGRYDAVASSAVRCNGGRDRDRMSDREHGGRNFILAERTLTVIFRFRIVTAKCGQDDARQLAAVTRERARIVEALITAVSDPGTSCNRIAWPAAGTMARDVKIDT